MPVFLRSTITGVLKLSECHQFRREENWKERVLRPCREKCDTRGEKRRHYRRNTTGLGEIYPNGGVLP
ncbi:unnamed protein product [Leptidea sinapis]|uniref:Uncharacterized protein n=1 Tax=Leptidea sinapis TaxID=189913 RepID=A0A5E4PNI7_9NEOP|nr:unnamed protein product [Leptidea sinapis]